MGIFSGLASILGVGYLLCKDMKQQHSVKIANERDRALRRALYNSAEQNGHIQKYEQLRHKVELDVYAKINEYYTFYSQKYASQVGMSAWEFAIMRREVSHQAWKNRIVELDDSGPDFINFGNVYFNDLYPPRQEELQLYYTGEWRYDIIRLKAIKNCLMCKLCDLEPLNKVADINIRQFIIVSSLNDYYNDDKYVDTLLTKESCKLGKQEKIIDAVYDGYEFVSRPAGYIVRPITPMQYANEEEEALWPVPDEIKIIAINRYYQKLKKTKHYLDMYENHLRKTIKKALKNMRRRGLAWPKIY